MKFKKLSESQIKISIDRLTRFKPTEEKYLRVFKDIIISCLIDPVIKKSDLDKMDYCEIRDLAVEIFNSSFEQGLTNDYTINLRLKDYENSLFNNSIDVQYLLDNKLNYKKAIELITNEDVLNLRWLKLLANNEDLDSVREMNNLLYPIEKVVIAEGITEEILLPEFADFCGYNFDKNGVKVIAAGGKNQVVKLYYKLSKELKIPIFVLLDKDAQSNEELIHTRLRETDRVYLLDSGEFEDLLPKKLIVRTINNEFKNFLKLSVNDLESDLSMVKVLEEIFKEKCLHEFKKAEFAQRIKQQISTEEDISVEVRQIVRAIKSVGIFR